MKGSVEFIGRILRLALVLAVLSSCGDTRAAGDEGPGPARAAQAGAPNKNGFVGASSTPVKRALIIAISDYGSPPPDPNTGTPIRGYRRLNSVNDTTLLVQALGSQGFERSNISMLLNEDASVEGIRGAFGRLVLDSQPGDIVVIHFSGHGHQIADQDAPLEEPDGYDELLVPYGAPAEFFEGYDGSLHIRDDEVGLFLSTLREKVGSSGNVTIFLDSCFSGTGTRGSAVVRGESEPLGPPAEGARQDGEEPGFESVPAMTRGGGEDGLAPFAFLAAASHRQEAYETTYESGGEISAVGSLSYALAWALPRLEPGATYRDLFTEVKRALNGKINLKLQTPQLEGSVDRELFSNQLRVRQPFFEVQSVLEGGRVVLSAGSLLGLGQGASVEFHQPGVSPADSTIPLATGRVVRAEPLRAMVMVDSLEPGTDLNDTHVFATTLAHGFIGLRVRLAESLWPEERVSFLERFTNVGVIEVVDDSPDVTIERNSSGVFAVMAQGGEVFGPPEGRPLSEALVDIARNRFLRQLHLSHDQIRVDLQLAPVEVDLDVFGEVAECRGADWEKAEESDQFLGGNQWQLDPGDFYRLRIVNDSERSVFVTVVDLMPRGQHTVIIPGREASAGSVEVSPHLSFELGCFMVDPELGHETLKLFATTTEMDLRPVFGSGTTRSGNNLSSLQTLIDSRNRATRSEPVTAAGSGSTVDVHILVGGHDVTPIGNSGRQKDH